PILHENGVAAREMLIGAFAHAAEDHTYVSNCRVRTLRGTSTLKGTGESPLLGRDRELARRGRRQKLIKIVLGLVLVLVERVHQLGREDLLGAREHLLLAGGQALLALAQRQVAHDLGELV